MASLYPAQADPSTVLTLLVCITAYPSLCIYRARKLAGHLCREVSEGCEGVPVAGDEASFVRSRCRRVRGIRRALILLWPIELCGAGDRRVKSNAALFPTPHNFLSEALQELRASSFRQLQDFRSARKRNRV
jgi:hypothetical protein